VNIDSEPVEEYFKNFKTGRPDLGIVLPIGLLLEAHFDFSKR
jgi:hypothetical protein